MSRFKEIRDAMASLLEEMGGRGKLLFMMESGNLTMVLSQPTSGIPPFQACFEETDFEPGREGEIIAEFTRRSREHFGLGKVRS